MDNIKVGKNTYISPTATLKGENIVIGDGCYIWSNIGKYVNNGITVSLDYQELPNYLLGVCTDEPLKYLKNG